MRTDQEVLSLPSQARKIKKQLLGCRQKSVEGKRRNEFEEWQCGIACGVNNVCRMTEENILNGKLRPFLAPIKQLQD